MAVSNKTILSINNDPLTVENLNSALSSSYTLKEAVGLEEALAVINYKPIDLLLINCSADIEQMMKLIIRCHSLRSFCKIILVDAKHLDSYLIKNPKHADIVSLAVHGRFNEPADPDKIIKGINFLINEKNTTIFLDTKTDKTVKYRPDFDEEEAGATLYSKFLESFRIGVCMVDAEGRVEYINKKGCSILGYQIANELLDQPLSKIISLDNDSRSLFLKKYIKRDWKPLPLEVIRSDKTFATMQANISFSESNPPHIVTLFFNQN